VNYFAGIDIGASAAKVAVIDEAGDLVGQSIQRSGVDFAASAAQGFAKALTMAGIKPEQVVRVFACGYGRQNAAHAHETRTEIAAHAAAAFHYFPQALTVVDIGGQDNKIIKVNAQGRRTSFKMNRKCAAGTGAFLEEMALRLGLELADLDGLARQAEQEVTLGSFCTVFTASEILSRIREGAAIQGLVKGLFRSVLKRVAEMDTLENTVVMTGGVAAHNPYLVQMLSEELGRPVLTPPRPQLAGAEGAGLLARKAFTDQPRDGVTK
jgi:predicted CoA-substrate-specific enzyme activase